MIYPAFEAPFLKEIFLEALKSEPEGPFTITRHYMYSRLMDLLSPFDGKDKECLVISHSIYFAKVLGLRDAKVVEANYPEHNILSLRYPDNSFDFCISDQVFEHIEGDPFTAFKETLRIVKPGGFIAHSTCFINQFHGYPSDYWRFTPEGLKLLCRDTDAKIVECGGWGNKNVWPYLNLGLRTAKVPLNDKHPINKLAMENDPEVPIHTWIIVQKKGHE